MITLYVLGALLAGFNALQSVAQSAIIPNLVDPQADGAGAGAQLRADHADAGGGTRVWAEC